MNDLNHLLDRLADNAGPTDPAADIERGRVALKTRRRRNYRIGVAGFASVAILSVGMTAVVTADRSGPSQPAATTQPSGGIRLSSAHLAAGPYTFDTSPEGWAVESIRPDAVTIAPQDGSVSTNPNVYTGKLVILFDSNPLGNGNTVTFDGRDFTVRHESASTSPLRPGNGSADSTTISTRTRAGEPDGVVRIQFPGSSGWTQAQMLRFLASVHVGSSAQHSLG
ncbi:MAG TPA: hypothetical protein VFE15_09905 [Marmoricola sp.]|jgi:hypothetical protein|nr:hypothetical protein [Marmoricola sp.]